VVGGYENCYTGSSWNTQHCPDDVTCAKNCAVDGADYAGTYGITTSGSSLKLAYVTKGQYGSNIGSRVYLMAPGSDNEYFMFKLKNQEFTFDADISTLPCGLNGALYFVDMDQDGGAKYGNNKAGAKFGTGYCDAQCPHDIKFIRGEANSEGWVSDPTDPNVGKGKYGSCCTEMDIWEANQFGMAYTPHVCNTTNSGEYRCSNPVECGDDENRYKGVCDKNGCDLNPYRVGNKNFFGPGAQFGLDNSKPFTVVTQFITDNNQSSGKLVEIRRKFKQNGKVIEHPSFNIGGKQMNSVTDGYCDAATRTFGDQNIFEAKGGLTRMGNDMDGDGMVLTLSLWDDGTAFMLWLDSLDPPTEPADKPGVARGPCPITSGRPNDVRSQHPNAYVTYSNIKIGDFDTTY